ncbi:cation:proton antiporter domain-containing protein [Candidatus Lucifugimonas marina]|uniref:Cation/H+ exchanger transmembrane domain-containing protein n=1 Tax=Candidatus Lucifugimonas marina TaxID=3038979 RepID=A0AAJ6CW66_9CHLR|nr:hypothetical protein [SAR202 cluster bacterium JH702]MDG0869305.1 hypothetical protein [SAR202 cluster bacterium JH639]WFG36706.1 hypothetical protein GKN94_13810 [SAR202 cluster bacterium JH545]WFG40640.1 hypothetical protein GKO48_13855 [SAR202 cluster bacterium JH1073]
MNEIVVGFALVAVVLLATPIISGVVDRSPLSFAFLFLLLGLALGESGFGVIDLDIHDRLLEVIATLTLSLVLFLDAVKLQIEELRSRWFVPALTLGPGTTLIISLLAAAIAWLIDLPIIVGFIGGAVLASTDPVVLRELIRDHRIPRSVRQTLRIEAGMNDLVVLPTVLILAAIATSSSSGAQAWIVFIAKLLLLGPAIGFVVGGLGSWLMVRIDKATPIRRELQSMYGLGLVLGSYAAGTAVGGDGFLAAFAAGLAVVLLNQTLCDCFLEYGEVTSEMAMLLSFILFGIVLSGLIPDISLGPALALALIAIFLIRPLSLTLVLLRAHMSWEARGFVAWFGPRGLNSLLLALLVVQLHVEGAEILMGAVGVIVFVSTILHGASSGPAVKWYAKRIQHSVHEEEREADAAGIFEGHSEEVPRVTPDVLNSMLQSNEPPILLDVRSRFSYEGDGFRIAEDVRVQPDELGDWLLDREPDRRVVAYCT